MKHELWVESNDEQTFCLSGPQGDEVRALLGTEAKRIWTCEASSHFEAMTKYYKYMGWGEYNTEFPEYDKKHMQSLGGHDFT